MMNYHGLFIQQNLIFFFLQQILICTFEYKRVTFIYAPNSHNVLNTRASGNGGLDEFRNNFDESERMYGLLRVTDIIDGHTTIKFVFISWAGSRVRVVPKAKMATHKGSITNLIGVCIHFSELQF